MITKQKFYKELKEKKLFSKYCMSVAVAFCNEKNPRDMKDGYEADWLSGRFDNYNDIRFWPQKYIARIQP